MGVVTIKNSVTCKIRFIGKQDCSQKIRLIDVLLNRPLTGECDCLVAVLAPAPLFFKIATYHKQRNPGVFRLRVVSGWFPGRLQVVSESAPGVFRVGSGWFLGRLLRVVSGSAPDGFRVGYGWAPGRVGSGRVRSGTYSCSAEWRGLHSHQRAE
jgi:hypothetical protein